MSRKDQKGFTLPEVLIAVMIAAVIFTGLLMTLRAGLAASRKIEQNSLEIHETRLFFHLLEKELRNSLFYSAAPFSGEETKFSFPALLDEYDEDETSKKIVLLTYEFKNGALYKLERPLREGSSGQEEETSQKIIPTLKRFIVQYAYRKDEKSDIFWMPGWPKGLGLPRGIRIILEIPNNEGKKLKDQRKCTINRDFYIQQGNWGWAEKALS